MQGERINDIGRYPLETQYGTSPNNSDALAATQ
jgi:hypothetical protein